MAAEAPVALSSRKLRMLCVSSLAESPLNAHILTSIHEAFASVGEILDFEHLSITDALIRGDFGGIDALMYIGATANERMPLHTLCCMARMSGAVSVFWATDDPYEFDMRHRALDFDCYFSNDKTAAEHFIEHGRVKHLPLGASPTADLRNIVYPTERDIGLFFCGYPYSNRKLFVSDLLSHPDFSSQSLVVAGPNWNIPRLNVIDGAMTHASLVDIYGISRFVLSIGRSFSIANNQLKLTSTTPGPRTFETAMAGTVQLHVLTSLEIEEYFEPDSEIILVESADELAERMAWFNRHPEEWMKVATAAQQRCLRHHTYKKRIAAMLLSLKEWGVMNRNDLVDLAIRELSK